MSCCSLVRSAAALLVLVAAAHAADTVWPGWLGPERSGWVAGFPSMDWPDDLHRVWTVETGTGYGSPLVADGRVFQHARQNDSEVVWCLDLQTGDVIWRTADPMPFTVGGGAEFHGKGPKSSPALADGRIFTLSISGVLTARRTDTGDVLWRRDDRDRYQPNHPYWGAATSVLVDDDRVFVHLGNDDRGALLALDAATGEEIWNLDGSGPSYASPVLADIEGVTHLVEWNHEAVIGVDPESGRALWQFPFPHEGSNQNMPSPVVHHGRVFVGGENRGVLCIEPQRRNDGWTATLRWRQDAVALDMSTAIVNDGMLFGLSHYGSGRLFCLHCEQGELLWQSPGRTGDHACLFAIAGHMEVLTNDGQLTVIRAAGDRFAPVAAWQVSEEPTWAPPVLLPDQLLIKDRTRLTKWSLRAPQE